MDPIKQYILSINCLLKLATYTDSVIKQKVMKSRFDSTTRCDYLMQPTSKDLPITFNNFDMKINANHTTQVSNKYEHKSTHG